MEQYRYIPGDLVMYKGNVETIVEVDRDNTLSVTTDKHPFAPLSNIKPIPLTPEILEKNGWKKYKNTYGYTIYSYKRQGYPKLNVINDNKVEFHWGDKDIAICNVHELQHLLFGLGLDSRLEV